MNTTSDTAVNKEPSFYANQIPNFSTMEEALDGLRNRSDNPVDFAVLMVAFYALKHKEIYKSEPTELYKTGEARKACDAALAMLCHDFGQNENAAIRCVLYTMDRAKKQLANGNDSRWSWRWAFATSKSSDYRAHMARKGEDLPKGQKREEGTTLLDESASPRERFDSNPNTRPGTMIVVRDGSLAQLVERALMLIAEDENLFVNSDRLVMLGDNGLVDVTVDMLIARLTGAARWVREVEAKDDKVVEKDIDCPLGIAKAVHGAKHWPGAKKLVGIVDHPVMRPDGTILDVPGYDHATGYYYRPTFSVPQVEDKPTAEQAKEALDRLLDLFVDFHYQNPKQRIVGIAAILTLIGRGAIDGPVPAFFFDAPDKASGKTLHLETISRITTGKDCVAAEFSQEVSEQSKRFVGWAREGAVGIFADNLKTGSYFGSEVIDRHLTATRVDGRSLGKTGQIKYDWRAVIVVSGNNVQVRDETARRTLIARLYPLPPEKKDFKHDLRHEAIDNRGALVADALTILRHHAASGKTRTDRPSFDSFEQWQRVIADAIVAAGGDDPVQFCADNDPNQSKADPDIAALILLVRNWAALSTEARESGEAGVSARALARSIWAQSNVVGTEEEDFDTDSSNMVRSDSINELGDALLDPTFLFDPKHGWTKGPSKLGVWFRKVKEKAIPGRLVVEEGHPGASKTWRLVSAKMNRSGAALWTIRADGDTGTTPTLPLVLTPPEPKKTRKEQTIATH